MSATLVETLPLFRLDFNLTKALEGYAKTKNSYAEGSLCRGAFNRATPIGFEAKLGGRGVQRMEFDGKTSFVLPVFLGAKEMKAMRALGNRLVEEATKQTKNDEDQWEFVSSVRADKAWNVKVKLNRQGGFMPEINGGEVTRDSFEGCGSPDDKVKIVGIFGIWMNPERGQFGIKFDCQRIDF
jgi:hypothetical protein